MYFTEGKDLKFEKMMQEVPGVNKHKLSAKERDCKHCLYYDKKVGCKKNHCTVFEDE